MELAFISPVDMGIVMVVALMVFGPKRMPEVARQVGGFVRDLKKTMGQFTDVMDGVKSDVGSHVEALPKFDPNHVIDSSNLMKPYDQPGEHDAPIQGLSDVHGLPLSTLPPRAQGEDSVIQSSANADAKIKPTVSAAIEAE